MKILNLYAGLGGNRFFWYDCEVTAIEKDVVIAKEYKKRFTNDNVIVTDAHEYLLNNYKNFDFIWSSPPCPSHSKARFAGYKNKKPCYPDFKLYEEIVFLQTHLPKDKFYVVENVKPYYKALIEPYYIGRNCFWSNVDLSDIKIQDDSGKLIVNSQINSLIKLHKLENVDFSKIKNKLQVLRNTLHCEIGKEIYKKIKKNI